MKRLGVSYEGGALIGVVATTGLVLIGMGEEGLTKAIFYIGALPNLLCALDSYRHYRRQQENSERLIQQSKQMREEASNRQSKMPHLETLH